MRPIREAVRSRAAGVGAGLCLTLALSVSARAQGQSQEPHGNGQGTAGQGTLGQGNAGQKSAGQGKGSQARPSQSVLPAPAATAVVPSAPAAAAPFAWVDNATLMPTGLVWVGFSMTRWQGAGLSEVNLPVVDAAFGLTPRVQFGATVPRIAGSGDPATSQSSLGTTFFNAKIEAFRDDGMRLGIAVAPTLEILGRGALDAAGDGRSRAQFGLPVSVDVDRGRFRVYGSGGYFSPAIWFTGAGVATGVGLRTNVAIAFSRAWSHAASADPSVAGPIRNDLTGSISVDVTPHIGVFGSFGHTIATREEDGSGTTLSVGLSLTARPMMLVK